MTCKTTESWSQEEQNLIMCCMSLLFILPTIFLRRGAWVGLTFCQEESHNSASKNISYIVV